MHAKVSLTALVLVGASALATTAFAAAPAAPAAPAPENPKVKTVATFADAEGTENLCQAKDGAIYVTLINAKKVLKVGTDGKVSEFISLPAMAHVLNVACGDNEFAVVAYGKTFRKPNPSGQGAAVLNFGDVDTHVFVFDAAGKQTADIAIPMGQGYNGLAYDKGNTYYAGDSNSGGVYKVDTKAKTAELWFKDDSWGPSQQITIGVNGVRVKNGWVYVASAAKMGIYKVQIGADGKAQGAPVKLEEGVRPDDFDVTNDGTVYFPGGTTLYKVTAAGEVSKYVEPIQGGPSALISADGKWVYWPTRGGTAPQRLVRVAIE
jgi:hypothetical protein